MLACVQHLSHVWACLSKCLASLSCILPQCCNMAAPTPGITPTFKVGRREIERKLEAPTACGSFIKKMSLPRIPQLAANYVSFTRTISFDHTRFKTVWE